MLSIFLFRAVTSLIVAGLAGGLAAIRHPLFLTFLGLEAALSLVEGYYSGGGGRPRGGPAPRAEQLPFIMSGKYYLLARFLYQVAVLAWFARLALSGAIALTSWSVVGGVLMALGVALRAWSMAVLGERFRSFEVTREGHGLETHGPYAMVRHPGYLALALIDVAVPLLLGVPWLALLVVVPLAAMVRRISHEEQLLAATYPGDFAAYAARSSRIVPPLY
jgi:protein-S-isoprenylcysteine O-methyltransferase Ste14